ncbi:MAG: nitroreductase family protein [Phycisphaeraceae bacterium]|nr:nitroreductase family protein [Phycisphaeraceae bacterium]
MMHTYEAIRQRRSVKHFDPNHEMTAQQIDELLSLAMLSPTAFNLQHWRFVTIKDKTLRQEIRDVAWNQAQVTDASLLLVMCADSRMWDRDLQRLWVNAPQEVQDMLIPAISGYYKDNKQVQRDEVMRSCGIAAQTIMLGAKAMGYDSCPMDGFDFGAAGKLINLPEDHIITMMIAVGKGIKPANPRGGQLSLSDVVVVDRF